jgi:hypothetical protein
MSEMALWPTTKSGVLDECMIELPQLTDGNVRRLWPKRERMRIWLTSQGYQIHKFPDVSRWNRSQAKAEGDGNVVPAHQA